VTDSHRVNRGSRSSPARTSHGEEKKKKVAPCEDRSNSLTRVQLELFGRVASSMDSVASFQASRPSVVQQPSMSRGVARGNGKNI